MKPVLATLALAALTPALPTGLDARQFEVGPPETSFPGPITAPPVTLPPDVPVVLPPISGPIHIGKREATKGDEFIIFPPKVGPLIPDKPVGGHVKPEPTVPGGPMTPST